MQRVIETSPQSTKRSCMLRNPMKKNDVEKKKKKKKKYTKKERKERNRIKLLIHEVVIK
jgi:hypothetical protein